jgi:hypothetical protein
LAASSLAASLASPGSQIGISKRDPFGGWEVGVGDADRRRATHLFRKAHPPLVPEFQPHADTVHPDVVGRKHRHGTNRPG